MTAQSAAEKASGQTLQQQQAAAKAELPGLQKQYNQLEAQLKKNEAQAQGAVEDNNGILAQLQDLSAAGAKNPMLSVAQWVVTLLFFCIEILPVMVKVLLNLGPLSIYETCSRTRRTSSPTGRSSPGSPGAGTPSERRTSRSPSTSTCASWRKSSARRPTRTSPSTWRPSSTWRSRSGAGRSRRSSASSCRLGPCRDRRARQRPGDAGLAGRLRCPGRHSGTGAPGGTPVHVTGPQPRLSLTGPQPVLGASGTQPPVNGGHPGSGYNGVNGSGASGNNGNGQAPKVTYLTPPGGGYVLPDDEDGDLL